MSAGVRPEHEQDGGSGARAVAGDGRADLEAGASGAIPHPPGSAPSAPAPNHAPSSLGDHTRTRVAPALRAEGGPLGHRPTGFIEGMVGSHASLATPFEAATADVTRDSRATFCLATAANGSSTPPWRGRSSALRNRRADRPLVANPAPSHLGRAVLRGRRPSHRLAPRARTRELPVLALANRSADAHADAAPARACVRLAEPPLRHRASTSEELPAVAALPADAAPTAKAADMDNAATEASEACCARPRGRSRGSRGRRRSSRRSFGRARRRVADARGPRVDDGFSGILAPARDAATPRTVLATSRSAKSPRCGAPLMGESPQRQFLRSDRSHIDHLRVVGVCKRRPRARSHVTMSR